EGVRRGAPKSPKKVNALVAFAPSPLRGARGETPWMASALRSEEGWYEGRVLTRVFIEARFDRILRESAPSPQSSSSLLKAGPSMVLPRVPKGRGGERAMQFRSALKRRRHDPMSSAQPWSFYGILPR